VSHEAFWQAAVPEPIRVLHVEMLPFSAGKIVLLHRAQSVFAAGGTVTEEQLAFAVLICGQPFADALAALNDPTTPEYLRKFRKRIGKFDLREHAALFQRYVQDGSEFPLQYAPKNKPTDTGITSLPFVQHVRCTLKHFYHVSDAEFWDMPWGLAQWDYYTAPVLNGTGDLVEKSVIASAQQFADEDFKRANPQLFKQGAESSEHGGTVAAAPSSVLPAPR
jgi:hypothetical protein